MKEQKDGQANKESDSGSSDSRGLHSLGSSGCLMDARWKIHLLGGLRATQGEREITRFRSRKTGALLAYLAYHRDRSHPREILIDLFWPDATVKLARQSLSMALTSLRRQLEPPGVPGGAVLITHRTTVRLNPTAVTTDVAEFEAALRAASGATSTAERRQQISLAVELYQGELLPGCYEAWLLPEQRALAELYFQAVHQVITLLEQVGDLHHAIRYACRAVSVDPLREESHYELIRLYAAAGQFCAALRQYQDLERLLGEPSAETRRLVNEIEERRAREPERRDTHTVDPILEESVAPPARPVATSGRLTQTNNFATAQRELPQLKAEPSTPSHLPLQFTRFFGREAEIARLEALLAPEAGQMAGPLRTRLVTLTGAGGTGKTRLALAVAGRLGESFGGAVWFVPLANLREPEAIPAAVRDGLRLPRSPDVEPLEQVVAALSCQPALLVLDNFEHLLEGGTEVVRTLRERVPGLACLVTSRQRLNLAGECEFPVSPLPTPTVAGTPEALAGCESVQLFLDRAQAVRPDFQVTAANAAAVADLCQRLEGIPLALELAAGRIGVLTTGQMVGQLGRRFDFLVSRRRDGEPRHQTLSATLDWSYDLLPPALQRFFARLSIFRGGWSLEAAGAVCNFESCLLDSRSGEEEAWDKDDPGSKRAELGADGTRPGEDADEIPPEESESRDPELLDALEQLREASWIEVVASGEEYRYRLLETMREYGQERLSQSGETETIRRRHAWFFLSLAERFTPWLRDSQRSVWLNRLDLEQDNLRAALDWSVQTGQAEVALRLTHTLFGWWHGRGYWTEGRRRLEEVIRLEGAAALAAARAEALDEAGALARYQGELEVARSLGEESLRIRREIGNRAAIVQALFALGDQALFEGDAETAKALMEETLAIGREEGWHAYIAYALSGLGGVALHREEYRTARLRFEEMLALARQLTDGWTLPFALFGLGKVAFCEGNTGAAHDYLRQSLSIYRERGIMIGMVGVLFYLGLVSHHRGEPEKAARLCGAAEARMRAIGHLPMPYERSHHKRGMAELCRALSEQAFAVAWAEGQVMPLEEAIAYALEERAPGGAK